LQFGFVRKGEEEKGEDRGGRVLARELKDQRLSENLPLLIPLFFG